MNSNLDRQFLARDAHRLWERRVRAASDSVGVFTPYLDRTLATLLRKAQPGVELAVVTDLFPASGVLDYGWQLRGVRKLLEAGVEVRSLRRLHAKVLLVDGSLVTVGSQNFTAHGRGSKETTAAPEADLAGSRFLATLENWFDQAAPVDLALVEHLLQLLDERIAKARTAQRELVEGFEEALKQVEQGQRRESAAKRMQEELDRARSLPIASALRAAAASTRYRAAQDTAYARLDWDETWSYQTLKAQKNADLTQWNLRIAGLLLDTVKLGWLDFYPAILGPHGRTAFVRVARSRISYVWRGVSRGARQPVAGERLWLILDFPDRDLDAANVVVTARWNRRDTSGYQMRLRFDGQSALRADGWGIVGRPLWPERLERAVESAYEDGTQWEELLRGVFAPAPRPQGFRREPNADKFFPDGWHRLDLVKLLDRPVLVIQPT